LKGKLRIKVIDLRKISVRKLKGLYMGRKFGSVETNNKFLKKSKKPRNNKVFKRRQVVIF
jgi:hypothetical protein